MKHVSLGGERWTYDDKKPLGSPGAFGAVYSGKGPAGVVAVKRLHVSRGETGERELQVADFLLEHRYSHIIPIHAVGTDERTGQYFIVMGKAKGSLREFLDQHAPVEESVALDISLQIAKGLDEMGDLVHRDLKPANILFHDGAWKLADLGLARFMDVATAKNTMKGWLSAAYAAPEQWKGKRAVHTTDIYALGCILHELITGRPPFPGASQAEYRAQHLKEPAPALRGSPSLAVIAMRCLSKSPDIRPGAREVIAVLERLRSTPSDITLNPLREAATKIARKTNFKETVKVSRKEAKTQRVAAAENAIDQLLVMIDSLVQQIRAVAPNVMQLKDESRTSRRLRLGKGALLFDIPLPHVESGKLGKKTDLLVGGMIEVRSVRDPVASSRSANLWCAKLGGDGEYGWWEAGYMHAGKVAPKGHVQAPFSIGKGKSAAGSRQGLGALASAKYRYAHNPIRIDGVHFADFCRRWSNLFAEAAVGKLDRPKLPMEEITKTFRLPKKQS